MKPQLGDSPLPMAVRQEIELSSKRDYQVSLATYRDRLPSLQELIVVFSSCAFPIYAWSILNVLYKVPAWVKAFSIWDLIGIIGYTQVFTMIEALFLLLALVVLALVLPAPLLRERFVAHATMLALSSTSLVILVHLNNYILAYFSWPRKIMFAVYMGLIGMLYLATVGISYALIRRSRQFEKAVISIGNRFVAPTLAYVAVSIFGLVVIFLRFAF